MRSKHSEAAEIAPRQHGRITTRKLIECGWQRNEIAQSARAGRLHRVHQGVFKGCRVRRYRWPDVHADERTAAQKDS